MQVTASEVVFASPMPRIEATRAPDHIVARAQLAPRQTLVEDGLNRDVVARVTDVSATIEETKAGNFVVAALEPGAPARRAALGDGGIVVPSFDVVRISANGNAVLAGRAEPGADVVVLDRGRALGQVKANDLGEWVLVPLEPLSAGTTALYVEAALPGTSLRRSDELLVLSVPQRSASQGAGGSPLAVVTPRAGGATRVLQGPKRPVASDARGPGVSLDVLDYDDAGNAVLSGRADAAAEVRVYADNRYVGTVRSDKNGDWKLKLDERITPGDHELRVDRVFA